MKTKQITITVPSLEGYKTLIANSLLAIGGIAGASDAVPAFTAWLSAHPGAVMITVAAANILLRCMTDGPVGGEIEDDVDITPHTPETHAAAIARRNANLNAYMRTHNPYDDMPAEHNGTAYRDAVTGVFACFFAIGFCATFGALSLIL